MDRILVFGMTENPGGVESFLMNYYRKLDRENLQFDFLCNTQEVACEQEITSLGGRIWRIPARRDGRRVFYAALNDFMRINAEEYTALWVNVSSLANIDYLIYAKRYGIKKRIIHSHNAENMDGFIRGMLHRINRLRVRRYATDLWACSGKAARWFYGSKAEYELIPNAVDIKKFRYNPEIRKQYRERLELTGRTVLGHVGRFHFQKNHYFLLDVLQELKKKDVSCYLLLIGQGELYDDVKKAIEERGLTDYAGLLGVRTDLGKLYQAMDIFLLPSLFEGLPVAALEAQAAGLPCILSDTITKEVKVTDYVKFMEIAEGAGKWCDAILEMKQKKRADRANQRAMWESCFNIEHQVKKLEEKLSGNN